MNSPRLAAIPTCYCGAGMRSLLEAKWAAFFDLLGWRWFYEPMEFDGWIPDFVLIGAGQRIFVEVKPVFEFPTDVAAKIDGSGCPDEVLIVGVAPVLAPAKDFALLGPPMGWLRETYETGFSWESAHFHGGDCLTSDGMPSGFHHAFGSYADRISGFYDGNSGTFYDDEPRIVRAWHEAANAVQWKPRRGATP